ncbi:MAG: hypothetical protein U0Q12_04860 [Vicinamibacterales bacterium]
MNRRAVVAFVMCVLAPALLWAQTTSSPPAETRPSQDAAGTESRGVGVGLELQLVVSRFQGTKLVSSTPYTLSGAAGRVPLETSLMVGAEVPVPANLPAGPRSDEGTATPRPSVSYRNVGTTITCRVEGSNAPAGRYQLMISIDDSSVLPGDDGPSPLVKAPVFRSFRSRANVVLQDGLTRVISTATDRASGEIVKVEATLRVVK